MLVVDLNDSLFCNVSQFTQSLDTVICSSEDSLLVCTDQRFLGVIAMSAKTPNQSAPPSATTPLRKCIRCGAKAVKPRTGVGRTTRYRTMPTLAIPEDVAIPACGRCQSEYLDDPTSDSIAPKLQQAYLQSLRTRARVAIDILAKHISQRRLEQVLGLSQGYLSRIRAGAGNPSPELVSHLALLCQDPPTRLIELERFWALPDEEWPPMPQPPSRRSLTAKRAKARPDRPAASQSQGSSSVAG